MKLVILDGYTTNPGDQDWDWLKEYGELAVYDRTPPELTVERAADAEILITNKTLLGRDVLEQLPNLRFIELLSTGYNVVDCDYARSRGIPVCNIPTYSTAAVAQHVFAFLLEFCNQVGLHSTDVHRGDWVNSTDFCFWHAPLTELSGKTLGIIGFGKIGRAVAAIAQAMGMRVLVWGPRRRADEAGIEWAELDTLLAQSDAVTLHCPLTPETQGMVNAGFLSQMKASAYLINTSRGPVIDEQALADALNGGRLAGAGLDVLSAEPPRADNPLLAAKNCLITPHIAWAGFETRQRLLSICRENIRAYFAGSPMNVVNPSNPLS